MGQEDIGQEDVKKLEGKLVLTRQLVWNNQFCLLLLR